MVLSRALRSGVMAKINGAGGGNRNSSSVLVVSVVSCSAWAWAGAATRPEGARAATVKTTSELRRNNSKPFNRRRTKSQLKEHQWIKHVALHTDENPEGIQPMSQLGLGIESC